MTKTLIQVSAVKRAIHGNGKRITSEAVAMLDRRVRIMVENACNLVPANARTITITEITNAKS